MYSSLKKVILIITKGQEIIISGQLKLKSHWNTIECQEHGQDYFSSHRNTFIITRMPPLELFPGIHKCKGPKRDGDPTGQHTFWESRASAVGIKLYLESFPKWTARVRPEQVLYKHWCGVLYSWNQNAPERKRSELCNAVYFSGLLVGVWAKRKQVKSPKWTQTLHSCLRGSDPIVTNREAREAQVHTYIAPEVKQKQIFQECALNQNSLIFLLHQ